MNGRTGLILGCFLATTVGCDDAPEPQPPKPRPTAIAESFDPTTCGDIVGRVTWEGIIPDVPPFVAPVTPYGPAANGPKRTWPNAYTPAVDPTSKAVSGGVVFLRGVDPRRSRPWDLPPVRVEVRDYDYHVRQGDADTRTGFVRLGDSVEIVSHQAVLHAVRGRGAAFFTLGLADAEKPVERVFDREGVVELSSASGCFWARGNLFVTEHPYHARTDAEGRFRLSQVPPGNYELVCWLPDWHWPVRDRELDSESWQVTRLVFRPPVEVTQSVQVITERRTETAISISASRFAP